MMAVWMALAAASFTGYDAATTESSVSEDHTLLTGNVLQIENLLDPVGNCTSCHGGDLAGKDVGVSCITRHGDEW